MQRPITLIRVFLSCLVNNGPAVIQDIAHHVKISPCLPGSLTSESPHIDAYGSLLQQASNVASGYDFYVTAVNTCKGTAYDS